MLALRERREHRARLRARRPEPVRAHRRPVLAAARGRSSTSPSARRSATSTSTARSPARWSAASRSAAAPVRHRPEGGRPRLPAAVRRGARGHREHGAPRSGGLTGLLDRAHAPLISSPQIRRGLGGRRWCVRAVGGLGLAVAAGVSTRGGARRGRGAGSGEDRPAALRRLGDDGRRGPESRASTSRARRDAGAERHRGRRGRDRPRGAARSIAAGAEVVEPGEEFKWSFRHDAARRPRPIRCCGRRRRPCGSSAPTTSRPRARASSTSRRARPGRGPDAAPITMRLENDTGAGTRVRVARGT